MKINSTTLTAAAAIALLAGCVTPNAPKTADDGAGTEIARRTPERFSNIGTTVNPKDLPPFLSGITWCGGSNFCAVADRGGRLHPLTISVPDGGQFQMPVFGTPVTLEGAKDLEAVAFDPLRKTVWVADEEGPKISEHDIATGRRISDVEIPARLRGCRPNLATESLAISPDGLAMWTANEETLACDGPVADRHAGAAVRIFRFRRKDADSPWTGAGEWKYVTDPMAGDSFRGYRRSGVADLAVGGDGTLYALEAEFSKGTILPGFRTRVYSVDFTGADDTGAAASLESGDFRPVKKTLVYESRQILEMYEGLAFGPPLPDGGRLAVLVSDGDDTLSKAFRLLRTP